MEVSEVSLDIANYWRDNQYLTESNKNAGVIVAFDWLNDKLIEINTNIDLADSELKHFQFDYFKDFIQKNNFNFVLGLRDGTISNPSDEWTEKLSNVLKSDDIDYDEYIVDVWPTPIPEFDIGQNIFVLRYAYDEYSKMDGFASNNSKFKEWIEGSEWSDYFGGTINSIYVKRRVIVLCSDVGNLILDDGFSK
tara:strand:+ start:123 stop:701 length:579 start_codon:yes stop_codon:yes gene_type:complete